MKHLLILITLTQLVGITCQAVASPIFDPFLEKFQVGVFRDPDNIIMEDGFPKGIMEALQPDTVWIAAAKKVLTPRLGSLAPGKTKSLLIACYPDSNELKSWLFHHHKRLSELELEILPAQRPYHVGGKFLLAERLAARVFLAYQTGQYSQAAKIADRLTRQGSEIGLKPREIFVWDLRSRYLKSLSSNPPQPSETIWSTIFDLGSFDTGNAWAIWVARQRELGRPSIPPGQGDKALGMFLGKLRKTWLSWHELSGAKFNSDILSGLGGKILPKKKLGAHFAAYPNPPSGLTLQGWWAGGQRRLKLGNATHYEKIAARNDLTETWRVDIYRRASEIHILAGNWEAGLVDLKKALLFVKNGNGTKSIRRRLRQWNEQAIALASAQSDTLRLAELLALGQSHFQGQDLKVFVDQTARWEKKKAASSPKDAAKILVSRGSSPDLKTKDLKKTEVFAATVDDLNWDLWFRWGQYISAEKPGSAINNQGVWARGLASSDNKIKLETIMSVVANQFSNGRIRESLLRMTLEFDIGIESKWATAPWQSPLPVLIDEYVKDPVERHALLGLALTTGDMRGILSAAHTLPRKGLTEAEINRFLFPLPMAGPIRNAIEAAESDPALILAVAKNESLFDPAVRSRAGALGFMQIMPFHYPERGARFGKEHWSQPAIAIAFGDRLLQEGTRRYHGDPYMSLAGYNAGPKPTARWLKQLGGSCSRQEYVSWIGYPETRYYVEKVLLDREIYDSIIAASGKKLGH